MRPLWILLPLGLLYLVLGGRLVQLHAFPGDDVGGLMNVLADSSRLDAARGPITARDGTPLALDRPVYRLVLDSPWKYRRFHPENRNSHARSGASVRSELERLAQAAGLPMLDLAMILLDPVRSYKVVVDGLDPVAVRRLRVELRDLSGSGLHLEQSWQRVQLYGRAFSHVVGACRTDEQGQRRGSFGLEKTGEQLLPGVPGYKQTQRVTGRFGVNPAMGFRMPQDGAALQTTLDAALGVFVHAELQAGFAEYTPDWNAALVLDARSGEILAVHGLPDFDPQGAASGPLYEDSFFLPARSAVEPGSTFKPFVVAWALDQGVIRGDEIFHSPGTSIRLPGRTVNNANLVSTADMTAGGALVHSSNVVMVQIGRRLGIARMRAMLDAFHFWDPVKVLEPGFDRGLKPPEHEWKGSKGVTWTLPSVSFGQQLMINPLRLGLAYAALVRCEPVRTPRLLRAAPAAQQVPSAGVAPLRPQTSAYILQHMQQMVQRRAGRPLPHWEDLEWGGKSGTAQLPGNELVNTCTFVAVGPVADPSIVVVVVQQNPVAEKISGTQIAGPIAGRILRRALELRGEVAPILGPASCICLDSPASAATLDGRGGE